MQNVPIRSIYVSLGDAVVASATNGNLEISPADPQGGYWLEGTLGVRIFSPLTLGGRYRIVYQWDRLRVVDGFLAAMNPNYFRFQLIP